MKVLTVSSALKKCFIVTGRIREGFSEKVTKSHFWRMNNNLTNNGGTGWQKKKRAHARRVKIGT